MMKTNLIAINSIARNIRKFSACKVKTFVQPRPNTSSYQQFDKPIHLFTPKVLLHQILRKCYSHFAPSVKLYSTSTETHKCWQCSQDQPGGIHLCCHSCGQIQEIGDGVVDFFDLLGMKRQFAINTVDLTKNFRQLQSVIHPDKFSNKSDKVQQLSADWSSFINKAYKTLLAPIKRGEYILKQHGIEIPEGNTAVGKEFLLEMMERNEEVDDAQNANELQELLEKVHRDLSHVVTKLDTSLSAQNLDTALQEVITLRYLISLENSIKNKKSRLGILL